jgi:hypothetical protein
MKKIAMLIAVLGALVMPGQAAATTCTVGSTAVPASAVCGRAVANWVQWQWTYGEFAAYPSWAYYRDTYYYDCWRNNAWSDPSLRQRCDVVTQWRRRDNPNSIRWLATTMNLKGHSFTQWGYGSYPTCENPAAYAPDDVTEDYPSWWGAFCWRHPTTLAVYYYRTHRLSGDLNEFGGSN